MTTAIAPDMSAVPLRYSAPIGGVAGTSFKPEHLQAILGAKPQRGFFEVHAENYMGAGGPPHRALEAIRRDHPLSLHGVCMSIGGPQPLDKAHLARFRALVARYQPALVSEHLAWSTHETSFFNDLLPLPYTAATLRNVCDHIDQVQDAIRRPLLLENPSTYVAFRESSMSETDPHCCRADRLRAAARHQQCIRISDQSRLLGTRLPRGLSAAARRGDPSRRPCRAGRRRRRSAADRQP
jgi:uncharacterized protein (UPF0276 family)